MEGDARVQRGGPGSIGHNSENQTREEKIAGLYHSKKDRVFVRGIQGAYNVKEELDRLRAVPRVRKAKEIGFIDGPQCFSRHYVEPKDGITQTFHLHLEEYAPGASSQKHGHVNEAAFWPKMFFLPIAAIAVLYFSLSDKLWAVQAGQSAPMSAKWVAGLVLFSWTIVIMGGRLLPYLIF